MPQIDGPGFGDRFDPHDVQDVRERVVQPVVSSLVKPGDLQALSVGWGPQEDFWPYTIRPVTDNELWVLVRAAGETWQSQIWQHGAGQLGTVGEVAWEFANRLEDWICERVYWGELRIANAVIPARNG